MRIVFISLIILMVGCTASRTKVKWEKPYSANRPLQKVMVVSLANIQENRKLIEEELALRLVSLGYRASASYRYLEAVDNEDLIIQVLDENSFDGVITVSLRETIEESQYLRSDRYLADPDYMYFSNYMDATFGAKVNMTQYVVETNIFQRSDERIIFTALSETFNTGDIEEVVGDFASGMANAIRKAKVLEPVED